MAGHSLHSSLLIGDVLFQHFSSIYFLTFAFPYAQKMRGNHYLLHFVPNLHQQHITSSQLIYQPQKFDNKSDCQG